MTRSGINSWLSETPETSIRVPIHQPGETSWADIYRRYSSPMPPVFTAGHSTRPIEELLALLAERGVRTLVDVRRFPGSRRHPQFSRDALAASLAGAGIQYVHEPGLGGR